MQIAVRSLPPGRHVLRQSVPVRAYGELAARSGLEFRGEVSVEAVVDKMAEELFVKATVGATVEVECARCLEPCEAALDVAFEALYVPEPAPGPLAAAHVAERESQRLSYYSGGVVDLDERIIEALLMAVPMKPLCRPDCKGICPNCGKKLDTGACECSSRAEFGQPFKDLFGPR